MSSILRVFSLLIFSLLSFSAHAVLGFGGLNCGQKGLTTLQNTCAGLTQTATLYPANVAAVQAAQACNTCFTQVQSAVNYCLETNTTAGAAMLNSTLGALGNMQGETANLDAATKGVDSTKNVGAVTTAAPDGSAQMQASCKACAACSGPVAEVQSAMTGVKADSANTTNTAAQTGDATGSLLGGSKGWVMPALLGAAGGAVIGGLLGGDDDDGGGGNQSSESPPSLDPYSSSSSSSSTSSSSSSSSGGNVTVDPDQMNNPAIADTPTANPNGETGSGDGQVFVDNGGAIADPDSLEEDTDDELPVEDEVAATTGGGSTGGATGAIEETDGDTVVEDDGASLARGKSDSGSRGLASAPLPSFDYNAGGAASQPAAGSGSGMINGVPSRNVSGKAASQPSKKLAAAVSAVATSSKSLAVKTAKGAKVVSSLPTLFPVGQVPYTAEELAIAAQRRAKIKEALRNKQLIGQ